MLACELLYVASLDKSAATIGKHLIFLRHASNVSLLASATCTQKYTAARKRSTGDCKKIQVSAFAVAGNELFLLEATGSTWRKRPHAP